MQQCDDLGIKVRGIDLAAPSRGDCEQGDITDPAVADLIPEEADAVVHLAGLSRDSDCRGRAIECFRVNVMGTLNLLEAANRRRARQFIFASSEWVYDRFPEGQAVGEDQPIDPHALGSEYAASKLVSEMNLRQRFAQDGCATTILRFGIIYGPRHENWSAVESLLHKVATESRIEIGSRRTARCFIHVTDIAAAIRAAVGQEGFDILNIQGERAVSLGEILDKASVLLGRQPDVVEVDPGHPSIKTVSNRKAGERLNWKPEIDIDEGLRSLTQFLRLAP